MSILAAFRKVSKSSASTTVVRIAAPSPARSPRVVVPSLPPPCAKAATVRFWGDDAVAQTTQSRSVHRMPHRMRRSISEGPRPLPRSHAVPVMKRGETEQHVKVEKVEKFVVAVDKVSLVRSAAIKRPARKNKENRIMRMRI